MRTWIERFLKFTELLCLTICNCLLSFMVVGGMVNIVLRELMGEGIIWMFQTTTIFFAWSIFFGIFVVYRRGADVAIDLIVDCFNPRVKRAVKWFTSALTIFLFGTILMQAPKLISLQSIRLETIDLPRYVISLPLFFISVLIIISSLLAAFEPLEPTDPTVEH